MRVELYDRAATRFINAHDSALSCLELSLDGRILATASERGTLIRVWNTSTTNILQEVRRGLDTAIIFSIAISRSCDYLAVSSDKGKDRSTLSPDLTPVSHSGTVHVFPLRCFTASHQPSDEEEASNNQPAITQTMSSMLSYVRVRKLSRSDHARDVTFAVAGNRPSAKLLSVGMVSGPISHSGRLLVGRCLWSISQLSLRTQSERIFLPSRIRPRQRYGRSSRALA